MVLDCSAHVKIVELLMTAFSIYVKKTNNFGIYRV